MSHAFLSAGFRPMFLGAAIWAAVSMGIWISFWAGAVDMSPALDPLDWHVHEMVFGYGSAVLAGFLLTAVPNWTGRPALSGLPLLGLVLIWVAGRISQLTGANFGWAIDLAFLPPLWVFITREILMAGNRRNLPISAMIAVFWGANLLFHLDALRGNIAFDGVGARLGMGTLILLISLIGGRIIPAFTTNWLRARGETRFPIPFAKPDAVILLTSALALISWSLAQNAIVGWGFLCLSLVHLWRLTRWRGLATTAEPLIFALHLAYLCVPLGFGLTGLMMVGLDIPQQAGYHLWTVGAIGGMTLTVMTRATLGHSGRALTSGWAERSFLIAIFASAITRTASALGVWDLPMMHLSATLWIVAFALFALRYTRLMATPRA